MMTSRFIFSVAMVLARVSSQHVSQNDARAPATTTSGSIVPLPVAPVLAKLRLLTDAAKNQGAVCLDGSPGAYYFQPGFGDGIDKWYLHHGGGGWCESLDDCLERSKGTLGSSTTYDEFLDLEANGGYFSTNSTVNPLMYNWNHVSLSYCDGASFSGNNETTVTYKGTTLHWRGHRIREAMEADLFNNQGMANASDIVVSGCSAGGMAAYLHIDQWCDRAKSLNPSTKCTGLPDSGFFLDYQDPTVQCTPDSATHAEDMLGQTVVGDYHCGLKWIYTIQNATAGVNQDCLQQHTTASGEDWMCMFAEHTSEHIRWPLFAMQSQYDHWQVEFLQGIGGDAKTQELGDNITARVQSMLLGHNNESGAFLDSCHHHCGDWNEIRIDGDLISTAHQKWYNSLGQAGSKKLWNQNKPYPCDDCCSPN